MPMINCPTCGAGLKVPDGMAGRKARCNKCQNIFAIPAAPAAAGAPMAPPPHYAPPPQQQFAPPPQQQFAPPPQYAPQQHVQAPPQYAPQPMPAGQYPGPAAPPRPPAPRGGKPHDPFQEGPRKRKKKGFPVLLVSLLGGGLFLVILLVVLAIIFWPSGGGGADMAYMPDYVNSVASVQFKSLKQTDAWKAFTKADPSIEDQLKDAKNKIGIDKDDITSILLGARQDPDNFSNNVQVFAVRTSKAYTSDNLLDSLSWKNNSDTIKAGSYTVYKYKGGGFGEKAFCVPNGNVVVFANNAEVLKKIMERNAKPLMSDQMRSALGSVSFSSSLAMATDIKATTKGNAGGGGGGFLGGMGGGVPGIPTPQYLGAEVNASAKINIRATVNFSQASDASTAKTAAEGVVAMAKMGGGKMGGGDLPKLLESLKFSSSGSQLTVTANNIDPDWLKGMGTGGMGFKGMIPDFSGTGGPPINPGGGPINPGPGSQNPAPIGNLHTKFGPFTEVLNISPNEKFTYQFPGSFGQCTFTIKPQFDAILNIRVYQNGQLVTQDVGGGIKNNFTLSWNSPSTAQVSVQVDSPDNLKNTCTISFNQGGGGPVNPPIGGNPVQIFPNLNKFDSVPVGGQKLYSVVLQANKQCIITCNTVQQGYDPYIWLMNASGQVLAQDDDGGGFPNAKIVYTPFAAGVYTIKVGSFANGSGGNFNLNVQQ